MNSIPLLIPDLPTTDQLIPYLRQIDANKQYTNFGPLNQEFERRISNALSRPNRTVHVMTVANCTLGLELALQSLGIRKGDNVLIPSITFVATATAVIRMGGTPIFGEVELDSWTLTPQIALRALNEYDLKAVVPVSTFGCSLDTDAWDEFTATTGLPVLIDAAGAWGNQFVGTTTDVAFSFHATKSFGIGEGGAVASANPEKIDRIRRLSNFGLDTQRSNLVETGTNAKLSEYHCAVGLAAFDRWEENQAFRIAHMMKFVELLSERLPSLQFQLKHREGIYPILAVLAPVGVRVSALIEHLNRVGVGSRRWYCPALHEHDALLNFPKMSDLSNAEVISDRLVGIPYFSTMSDAQFERVVEALSNAIDAAKPI